jgi:hypothetical protein
MGTVFRCWPLAFGASFFALPVALLTALRKEYSCTQSVGAMQHAGLTSRVGLQMVCEWH